MSQPDDDRDKTTARGASGGGDRRGRPSTPGAKRTSGSAGDRGGPRRDAGGRSAGGTGRSDSRGGSTGRPTGSSDRGSGRPATGGERGGSRSGSAGGRPGDRATGGRRYEADGPRSSGGRGASGRPASAGRPQAGGRSDDPRRSSDRGRPTAHGRDDDTRGDRSARGGRDRGTDDRGARGSGRPSSGDDRGGRTSGRPAGGAARGGRPNDRHSSGPVETFAPTPRLEIPSWARTADLDPSVRSALRSLSARAAEEVSGHLAAAAELLDDDPKAALAHARVARSHAARVAVVREAVGIAAYKAEEWNEALSELRAAHRMSGELYLVPLLMDTERALGRPQAALKLAESLRGKRLDAATRVELAVVMSGVRRDLGSPDAALAVLEREDLERQRDAELSVRLWYAYADALEAAGRRDDAARWFGQAAGRDRDGVTDAAERAASLL